jgi:glycosyltransferase involved in cell wall biosynthesis
MKILFLLTQDLESPSGFGRYYPLARELVTLGHQVFISATHSNFQTLQHKRFTKSGVHIHYVGPMHVLKKGNKKYYYSSGQLLIKSLQSTWGLSMDAMYSDVDIVHLGKPHPMNSIPGLLTKIKKNSLYLDVDDYELGYLDFRSPWQRKIVSFFEETIPKKVDFLTVNNMFMMNRLIVNGVPQEKILYLSTGIDLQRFSPPEQSKLQDLINQNKLHDKKVISYIGSMSRANHPVAFLLESFSLLVERNPDSVLLLVGGGDDFDRLQTISSELGIAQNVRFCGRIPPEESVNYYYISHLSVDPVLDTEGGKARVPLKLLESLACGIPFITADVGDRSLLLGDPPAGILTKPGGMEQILRDPELAKKLASYGRKQAQLYSWNYLAKKLEAFYLANTFSKDKYS